MNTAEFTSLMADAHLLADLESSRIRLASGLVDVVPVASLLQLQVEARRAHYGALLTSLVSTTTARHEARAQAFVEALRAIGCEVPTLRYELDRHILDEALGRTQS